MVKPIGYNLRIILMRGIRNIILIIGMLMVSGFNHGQIGDNTPSKIKVTFLYNFTRFIEWPEDYKEGNFIIGVVGDTPLYGELLAMKENMEKDNKTFVTKGNQPISVLKYLSYKALGKCHIVFVSNNCSNQLSSIVEKTTAHHTLLVTEKLDLIENGAGINFVINENKIGFELNRTQLIKKGLSVSNNLSNYATRVI